MVTTELDTPAYVIKASDLLAINHLAPNHPRPRSVEWINRGTDQVMRRTTTDMLLRTLFQPVKSKSVQKLHDSAGLRIIFRSERDRARFAEAFEAACAHEKAVNDRVVTAIFDNRDKADRAIDALQAKGIPAEAISLLSRASAFLDEETEWQEGHSKMSIAGAVAGSGFAGAILGVAILLVPGVGPVAAAGAIASSALTSVASVSGIIGATGGAVAKMLTDHDVDGVSAAYYDQQIKRGKVFVSVDTHIAPGQERLARETLADTGGRTPERA